MDHTSGIFDLVVFSAILKSFSILVSKWPVTRKRLDMEQNGSNLGLRGVS